MSYLNGLSVREIVISVHKRRIVCLLKNYITMSAYQGNLSMYIIHF